MTPPGALPPALDRLSLLLPARQAMIAFAGGRGALASLLVLAAGALLSFAAAARLFEWDDARGRGARRLWALVALLPYAASALLS